MMKPFQELSVESPCKLLLYYEVYVLQFNCHNFILLHPISSIIINHFVASIFSKTQVASLIYFCDKTILINEGT